MKNRIGEVNYNKHGRKMIIIGYNGSADIKIKFDNGYVVDNQLYTNFKNGSIKNPYDKTNYGMGYIGEGKHVVSVNKVNTKKYKVWNSMLMRCYSDKFQTKEPAYVGCKTCEEWLNYQNFGDWFDDNYYDIGEGRMALDKDIIYKHNKVYSSETCVFVPQRINCLFLNRKRCRGKYPLGIKKETNYYSATYSEFDKENKKEITIRLGRFDTIEEAFNAYKIEKERYIKQVADEYKDKIPKKLYDALYNYEVEITD